MSIWQINLFEFVKLGGPIMIPIILCSVFAFSFSINKFLYLSRIKSKTPGLKNLVFNLIRSNKLNDALSLANKDPSPTAKILSAGIVKFGDSKASVKESMENASLFEIPKLEKYFTALVTIAQVSPLLGLLGTVTGLTGCFYVISQLAISGSSVTTGDLAGNIFQALITSVAGLMVAIPTFIIYNFLLSQVSSEILEMEKAATELLALHSQIAETKALE